MRKSFYSNGKLLITGEYLVLKGATAFAVPLNVGQKTVIETGSEKGEILWRSYYKTECWFEARFAISDFEIVQTEDYDRAFYIQKLLVLLKELNPQFLDGFAAVEITNYLGFHPDWGFGSSSTLISNLSSFAKVDAFEVNNLMSGGSGFDIACAESNMPILYQNAEEGRKIRQVTFAPSFAKNLYFIWLGNKKSTAQSINWFDKSIDVNSSSIAEINEISEFIYKENNLDKFSNYLAKHNSIMESVLGVVGVQKQYFDDFDGVIKSLGAWGGDFILAASSRNIEYVTNYFRSKGLKIQFKSTDLFINTRK